MITDNVYRLDNDFSKSETDILYDYGMGRYSDVQILWKMSLHIYEKIIKDGYLWYPFFCVY